MFYAECEHPHQTPLRVLREPGWHRAEVPWFGPRRRWRWLSEVDLAWHTVSGCWRRRSTLHAVPPEWRPFSPLRGAVRER